MSFLPQEIIDSIIDVLNDRTALVSCSLVCRAWLCRSHFHLFQSIRLVYPDGNSTQSFRDIIEEFLDLLETQPFHSRQYIQTLSFDHDARGKDDDPSGKQWGFQDVELLSTDLHRFAVQLPSLQHLSINLTFLSIDPSHLPDIYMPCSFESSDETNLNISPRKLQKLTLKGIKFGYWNSKEELLWLAFTLYPSLQSLEIDTLFFYRGPSATTEETSGWSVDWGTAEEPDSMMKPTYFGPQQQLSSLRLALPRFPLFPHLLRSFARQRSSGQKKCSLRSLHIQCTAGTNSDHDARQFFEDPFISSNLEHCSLDFFREHYVNSADVFNLSNCHSLQTLRITIWLHRTPHMEDPTDINYAFSILETIPSSSVATSSIKCISLILIKERDFDLNTGIHRIDKEIIDWGRLEKRLLEPGVVESLTEFVFDYQLNDELLDVEEKLNVEGNLPRLKARGILRVGE
ncbi:hypothetical protein ABKN59_001530 [Abortiporus biennis]